MGRSTAEIRLKPNVLKWARESSGWNTEEISTKLGVGTQEYNHWETGEQPVRLTTLEKLANYFKRPVATLLLSKPPIEPAPPTDFRLLPKNQSKLARKTILAIRRAQRLQRLARDLLQQLNEDIHPNIGKAKLSDNPEEISLSERRKSEISFDNQKNWKSTNEAFDNWRQAIENQNIFVFRLSMPIDDVRGFSLSNEYPLCIVVNSQDANSAKCFTLFHEYAHLLLNKPGICLPDRIPQKASPNQEIELWCNRFSASFLVPKTFMEKSLTRNASLQTSELLQNFLAITGAKCRVSRQVILGRLLDLNIISYRRFDDELHTLVATLKKRARGGPVPPEKRCIGENGRLFTSVALRSHEGGILTHRDLADYLSISVKYLDKVQTLIGT